MFKTLSEENPNALYEGFIEVLKEKMPERGQLVNALSDLLFLEKEAVYRRMRNEVSFSFEEIVKISIKFNISLDNIIGNTTSKNRPFQMRLIDYEKPTEQDFAMQQSFADIFIQAKDMPESEVALAGNTIPINLCMSYEHIYRFHRLKWFYQFGSRPKPYREVVLYDRLKEITREFVGNTKHIAQTYYIWDKKIIPSLIADVKYFECIRLISPEEVALIREDLLAFLTDFENLATNGCYPTGKKVYVYLTSISFESSFSYYKTNQLSLTNIRAFTLNDVISTDKQVFETIKRWTSSLIKTSTLISESNEIQRILFFEEQRKIVETL